MDRDWDRRPRDIPPEDRYGTGGGQSYRPGAAGRDRSPPPRRSPPPSTRVDSYRGRDRSPVSRVDSYTPTTRGPPLRPRSRSPPRADSYRRRSPTPPRYRDAGRIGGDSYRARPRSPPPARRELPRDDLFRREPPRPSRDLRFRDRSPLPLKRGRDPSPIHSRGRRTPPPPLKRDRLASPPPRSRYDDYAPSRGVSPPPPRGYSPPPPRAAIRDYRMRSRSPMVRSDRVESRPASPPSKYPRNDYYDEENGRVSVSTSRRSSPPVHPSRLNMQNPPSDERRPPLRDPYVQDRQPYRPRSPPRRTSPEPIRDHEMRDYDRGTDDRSVPPREPAASRPLPAGFPSQQTAPPTGPAASQPPAGPSSQARGSVAPPSGPRGDTSSSSSSRGGFATRGRGGYGADYAPRGRGTGFGPYRGGRGSGAPPPSYGRGSGSYDQRESEFNAPTGPSSNPPSGPRASLSQTGPSYQVVHRPGSSQPPTPGAPSYPRGPQRFPSANSAPPSNEPPTGPKSGTMPSFARRTTQSSPPIGPSSSTLQSPQATNSHTSSTSAIPTGPSADRRNVPTAPTVHPALQDLPKIIEGGQRLDPPVDRTRLGKLEEESERLRRQIEEREIRKRKAVREWDRLQREAETAALRSELAENSVRAFTGEEESMAAF